VDIYNVHILLDLHQKADKICETLCPHCNLLIMTESRQLSRIEYLMPTDNMHATHFFNRAEVGTTREWPGRDFRRRLTTSSKQRKRKRN